MSTGKKILHIANSTHPHINEQGSPGFDSSERDCRQNAVYSRRALSGSTMHQNFLYLRTGQQLAGITPLTEKFGATNKRRCATCGLSIDAGLRRYREAARA